MENKQTTEKKSHNNIPETKPNNPVKIEKAQKPDMSGTNSSFLDRVSSASVNTSFNDQSERDSEINKKNTERGENGESESELKEVERTNENNLVQVIAEKPVMKNTAVQHAGKHFDIVLGIDIHWTKIPVCLFPLPLPHPFIGLIFDPVEYLNFSIPVPGFLQEKFNLPPSIPMGATVFIHGRIRATTTTSVMGINLPAINHITGSLPVYKIFFGDLEGPHDGEVYIGSETVIVEGAEMSGSDPQQVLTCWGMPLGHQYFPPAWLSLYNHILTMYVQINMGNPVLIGGPFVPHKYTLKDILMRAAAVFLMKGIAFLSKKGMTSLNNLLKNKFGSNNPVSRTLCKMGFEPVNFVTGSMSFEWEDFEILGSNGINWRNIWESDNHYSGMLGNGVNNNYDLFIIPQEQDRVAAYKHPVENQAMALEMLPINDEFEDYRSLKLQQKRPDENTWIIKLSGDTYTYKSFYDAEFGRIYRVVQIDYFTGNSLKFTYNINNKVLRELEDNSGRKLLFTSDKTDKITSVTYKYRKTEDLLVRYEYDQRGNLIKVYDQSNKSIDFHYDENNRIIRRQNRNGMEYVWAYDDQGRVIHTTGKDGFQEGELRYFPEKGYNEIIYPQEKGKIERYYYDENNLIYKEEDAMGGETWYDYTAFNERKMIATPQGKITGYEYDEKGNISVYHTPDGEQYLYKYDKENRLIHRAEPSGLSENWEYSEEGLLRKWTRLDNSTIEYFYKEGKRELSSSLNNTTSIETFFEHNEQGQLLSVTNNRGLNQGFAYDDYGRLKSRLTDNEVGASWIRDSMGRVRELSGKNNKSLKIQYDAYDLPVFIKDDKEELFFEYTPMGKVKKQIRRSLKNEKEINTLSFKYDSYENLEKITNEKNEQYIFKRDKNDRVIYEKSFDGLEKRYMCNKDGEIVKSFLPGNREIFHDYDISGRLVYNKYNDGYWESFEYNKSGLLIKADNPMSELGYERNAFGQITKEIQGEHNVDYFHDEIGKLTGTKSSLGAEINYDYDPLGYLNKITAQTDEFLKNPGNKNKIWQNSFEYDQEKREIKKIYDGKIESVFEYDEFGRPVSQKVLRNGLKVHHSDYKWNNSFKLTETLNKLTGGKVKFDYNTFGSLLSAEHEDGTKEYKNPDEIGNLYKTSDKTENKTNIVYDKGGKLIKDKNWYYYYDEQGNLQLKSKRKILDNSLFENKEDKENKGKEKNGLRTGFLDAQGEIVYNNDYDKKAEIRNYSKQEIEKYKKQKGILEETEKRANTEQQKQEEQEKLNWNKGDWHYEWYSTGMLKSIKKPDGKQVEYEYDALGRRTGKIVYEEVFSSKLKEERAREEREEIDFSISQVLEKKQLNGRIYRYLWEGNVLLQEWDYDLKDRPKLVINEQGDLIFDRKEPIENLKTWIYRQGELVPCGKLEGDKKYSIISDYLGRPIQAFDKEGELVWEAKYSIYGELKPGNKSRITGATYDRDFIPFRQLGQYEDSETGLYYNRFRYYDCNSGLYISQDPIGLAGNNPNFYAYVGDSNTEVDPWGLHILDDPDWLSKVEAPLKSRHDPTKVKMNPYTKEINTMIIPGTDVEVDIEGIRSGQATRIGNDFEINGRTYGVHLENGRLFPRHGDGFIPLDRGGYKALGVYNTFGDTPKAAQILDNMGMEESKRIQALEVWRTYQ